MSPRVKLVAAFGLLGATLLASPVARAQDAAPADDGWFNGGGAPAAQAQAPQPAQPAQAPTAAPSDAPGPDETDPRAITEFRSQLEPYGMWVEDPKYGTVWTPNREQVGTDFAPYVTSGHWALAEDGDWVWVSDYPFGNIVFHYGRWVWIPESGWAWVPGYRYANAWVVWRVPTDDYAYVGWAPMPPTWGWYGGFAVGWGWYAPTPFVFCPSAYVFSYRVHTYIVHDRYRINEIAGHSVRYGGGYGAYGGYGRGNGAYGGHTPATPRAMPANSAIARGPSLQSAHVPSSAVPSSRVPNARPAYTAAERSGNFSNAGYRSYSSNGVRSAPSSTGSRFYSSPGSGYNAPRYVAPSTSRAGSYATPRYSAPSSAPSQRYSAPSSAPRYAPAQPHYSAPSAPAQRYSAPSAPRYSAPSAPHYSSPARGGGGGGGMMRGGGGHFRR